MEKISFTYRRKPLKDFNKALVTLIWFSMTGSFCHINKEILNHIKAQTHYLFFHMHTNECTTNQLVIMFLLLYARNIYYRINLRLEPHQRFAIHLKIHLHRKHLGVVTLQFLLSLHWLQLVLRQAAATNITFHFCVKDAENQK